MLIVNYIVCNDLTKGYRQNDFIDLKDEILRYLENKIMNEQITSGYMYSKTRNNSLFLGEYGVIFSYILAKNNVNISLLN